MTVVSELMPFLPENQRSSLARLVMRPETDVAQKPKRKAEPRAETSETTRFLTNRSTADVMLSAEKESGTISMAPGRLWGMLAATKPPELVKPELVTPELAVLESKDGRLRTEFHLEYLGARHS